MTTRFEGIFARLGMANTFNIDKAPFSSKLYVTSTILDPNFQLFWVDDLVEVAGDGIDPSEEEQKAAIKARLTGLYI